MKTFILFIVLAVLAGCGDPQNIKETTIDNKSEISFLQLSSNVIEPITIFREGTAFTYANLDALFFVSDTGNDQEKIKVEYLKGDNITTIGDPLYIYVTSDNPNQPLRIITAMPVTSPGVYFYRLTAIDKVGNKSVSVAVPFIVKGLS